MLFSMAANLGCYTPEARPLATAPFHNGAGFINALAGTFFGGTTHILSKFEPELLLQAVDERQITSMFMVPTHFHAIFHLGDKRISGYDVGSLKAIHSNAAPLPQATKERIVDYFGDNVLFETYGSTECGGCTFLRPPDQLRKISCVGQPSPGVWLDVRGADGEPVAPGEIGEVWIRNSWLFNGYWNKPEATAEAMVDGWCSVGDLGRLDDEGYLYLLDRKKNVIISGGQNIFPREIEEAAQIDGASRLRTLRSVVLPVASNGIITVSILAFMIAWGEFLYSIVILTDPLQYPVSALLSQQITMLGTNWPALMALSLLTALPIIVIYLVLQRRVIDGLSTGAVK